MRTVTVEIKKTSALKSLQKLELQHAIRILTEPDLNSPSLPGKQLSISEFRHWIRNAESLPAVNIKSANETWQKKRKQLQKITK
jgi:hypothetical protein